MPSERRVIHSFPVASKAGKPQQIEPPHVGNHRDIGERKDRPCEIAVARQRASVAGLGHCRNVRQVAPRR